MITDVDKRAMEAWIQARLNGLLVCFEEEEADDIREIFKDIIGWMRGGDELLGYILTDGRIGLAQVARTPIDRERIDKLIQVRELLELSVKHLEPITRRENEIDVLRKMPEMQEASAVR